MADRIEELASMRAPNQSGVDTSAVLRALAGNPEAVSVPTTYAYGMNVQDAQREAQLGFQQGQQRESSIRDARNAAMQQDAQQFDIAMKAHNQFLEERNLAIRERVAAAEIAAKQAALSRIPLEIERTRLQNEALQREIERERLMDSITIDVPDPANPGKTRAMPARIFSGQGGKSLLGYLTGTNPNETATERQARQTADIFKRQGFSDDGAALMATYGSKLYAQLQKELNRMFERTKTTDLVGNEVRNYGKNPDGSSKTEKQFLQDNFGVLVDGMFGFLPQGDRNIIKANGPYGMSFLGGAEETVPAGGGAQAQPTQNSLLSPEDMQRLQQALIEAYQ